MDDFLNFDSALEVHDSYGDAADSILESIINQNVDKNAVYSSDENDKIDDSASNTNPSYFEASQFKVIFNFLLLCIILAINLLYYICFLIYTVAD